MAKTNVGDFKFFKYFIECQKVQGLTGVNIEGFIFNSTKYLPFFW